MKLMIAAATAVALIGVSSSSTTTGVRLGAVTAPASAAVEQSISPAAQPSSAPQRFVSGGAPALKPIAAPTTKPAAAVDPSSPEAIGAVQMWRARGVGAIDTLKQVVEEMAKSVRKADVANVRNDCRLVGAVGDAISQSLPAPNKQVDTQFREAANSIKAGALKCQNWGPGLSKSQTDAFLQDMKDAANNIKATNAFLMVK